MKHNAEITIASDAAGLNSEFYFKATTGEKFPLLLGFSVDHSYIKRGCNIG